MGTDRSPLLPTYTDRCYDSWPPLGYYPPSEQKRPYSQANFKR